MTVQCWKVAKSSASTYSDAVIQLQSSVGKLFQVMKLSRVLLRGVRAFPSGLSLLGDQGPAYVRRLAFNHLFDDRPEHCPHGPRQVRSRVGRSHQAQKVQVAPDVSKSAVILLFWNLTPIVPRDRSVMSMIVAGPIQPDMYLELGFR